MKTQAPTIIGESAALAQALDHISKLAAIDRPTLIIGERGTGKELAAERLHFLSPRWDQTFTKINCSAVTETLLESELFGHEAGAFTGATKQHIGRFELTDGGTLFLDELATMSPRLQEKLLRVIEYGEFERVGGQKTLRVDIRLVAATNADLPALANAGLFRWDLLDRLSFEVVQLPPLRERDDDLLELAQHFGVRMCRELGWDYFPGFSAGAIRQLKGHHWPGNIRELKNVIERSLFRTGDTESLIKTIVINPFASSRRWLSRGGLALTPPRRPALAGVRRVPLRWGKPLPHDSADVPESMWPIDLKAKLQSEELRWLTAALDASEQRQSEAAALLGLTYDQMRALVRKHA
ncbi:MAG: sigma-54-dependent Fis family transcriptional regulator [Halieaceae bacterium]|nr:MAG: sigma-54-dependent Fis family transcriptional regulator [Halieaceae bacterium]